MSPKIPKNRKFQIVFVYSYELKVKFLTMFSNIFKILNNSKQIGKSLTLKNINLNFINYQIPTSINK